MKAKSLQDLKQLRARLAEAEARAAQAAAGAMWIALQDGRVGRFDGTSVIGLQAVLNGQPVGLWVTGPNDQWLSGALGDLLHYNGQGWMPVDLGTSVSAPAAVWGVGPGATWVGGLDGDIFRYKP